MSLQSPRNRKHKPGKTAGRRKLAGPFSRDEQLVDIDRRSHAGRLLRDIQAELHRQLGDNPSPAQRLLVQTASLKAVRLSLAAERILTTDFDGLDAPWLAWSNSLRADLLALGLKPTATEPTVTLESYIKATIQTTTGAPAAVNGEATP